MVMPATLIRLTRARPKPCLLEPFQSGRILDARFSVLTEWMGH